MRLKQLRRQDTMTDSEMEKYISFKTITWTEVNGLMQTKNGNITERWKWDAADEVYRLVSIH